MNVRKGIETETMLHNLIHTYKVLGTRSGVSQILSNS